MSVFIRELKKNVRINIIVNILLNAGICYLLNRSRRYIAIAPDVLIDFLITAACIGLIIFPIVRLALPGKIRSGMLPVDTDKIPCLSIAKKFSRSNWLAAVESALLLFPVALALYAACLPLGTLSLPSFVVCKGIVSGIIAIPATILPWAYVAARALSY